MHSYFSLTLQVTHDCNLRCAYCYAGRKFPNAMPTPIAHTALARAFNSLTPTGHLELGFFGGEPLLQASAILSYMSHAKSLAGSRTVAFHLTTNATLNSGPAWDLLSHPDLRVAISCDGPPEIHDRFRPRAGGGASSPAVYETIAKLLALGKDLSVILVVRPQTVLALPESLRFLRNLGVRHLQPSLDLWSTWTDADAENLRSVISPCADLWAAGLPDHTLSWFDDKLVGIAQLKPPECARCGFGDGELAVTPAGNLYPCERLIGDDTPQNPMKLAGHVLDGSPNFLALPHAAPRTNHACSQCTLAALCTTFCRCANFVRTGDVRTPDGLLCMWNQTCMSEVEKRMHRRPDNTLEIIRS